MSFLSLIARFFSVLALLGMLVIPVSTIAAQNAMTVMDRSSAQAMAGMDDMSCCPDERPIKPDCGLDCPLVVVCTTSVAMHLARADWSRAALHSSDLDFDPASEAALASLFVDPPARPPKA
jgi:hypothetical protein